MTWLGGGVSRYWGCVADICTCVCMCAGCVNGTSNIVVQKQTLGKPLDHCDSRLCCRPHNSVFVYLFCSVRYYVPVMVIPSCQSPILTDSTFHKSSPLEVMQAYTIHSQPPCRGPRSAPESRRQGRQIKRLSLDVAQPSSRPSRPSG